MGGFAPAAARPAGGVTRPGCLTIAAGAWYAAPVTLPCGTGPLWTVTVGARLCCFRRASSASTAAATSASRDVSPAEERTVRARSLVRADELPLRNRDQRLRREESSGATGCASWPALSVDRRHQERRVASLPASSARPIGTTADVLGETRLVGREDVVRSGRSPYGSAATTGPGSSRSAATAMNRRRLAARNSGRAGRSWAACPVT